MPNHKVGQSFEFIIQRTTEESSLQIMRIIVIQWLMIPLIRIQCIVCFLSWHQWPWWYGVKIPYFLFPSPFPSPSLPSVPSAFLPSLYSLTKHLDSILTFSENLKLLTTHQPPSSRCSGYSRAKETVREEQTLLHPQGSSGWSNKET